jgi:hypothetical protein
LELPSPSPRPITVVPFALALALDELPNEIRLNELRYEHDLDLEIMELLATGGSGCVFDVKTCWIIVRKAPLDGSEHILGPISLHRRVICL